MKIKMKMKIINVNNLFVFTLGMTYIYLYVIGNLFDDYLKYFVLYKIPVRTGDLTLPLSIFLYLGFYLIFISFSKSLKDSKENELNIAQISLIIIFTLHITLCGYRIFLVVVQSIIIDWLLASSLVCLFYAIIYNTYLLLKPLNITRKKMDVVLLSIPNRKVLLALCVLFIFSGYLMQSEKYRFIALSLIIFSSFFLFIQFRNIYLELKYEKIVSKYKKEPKPLPDPLLKLANNCDEVLWLKEVLEKGRTKNLQQINEINRLKNEHGIKIELAQGLVYYLQGVDIDKWLNTEQELLKNLTPLTILLSYDEGGKCLKQFLVETSRQSLR